MFIEFFFFDQIKSADVDYIVITKIFNDEDIKFDYHNRIHKEK